MRLMKISKRASLSSLFLFVLTVGSTPALGQPDQATFEAFSWEGLSLSLTQAQIESALEGQGYTLVTANENRPTKRVAVYQRKTATATNKVQIIGKNGALTKIAFSEVRAGRNNALTAEAADEILERIKAGLDLGDAACRANARGGGMCNGMPASTTHTSSFSVNVTTTILKIMLLSLPLPEETVGATQEIASGARSAYSCLGTADIASVREVYDCVQSSSVQLSKLPPQGSRQIQQTHRPIQLDYPTLSCANLADYYRKGLSTIERDASAIPSCSTFAAVVERGTGRPPYWSACVDPSEDAESFMECVAGYTPSLVNPNRLYLPSCEEVQRSYKIGVLSGQPDSKVRDVAVPDCDYVLAQAKSWRKELPEALKACEGYDPDKTAEHLMQCLSAENDYLRLTDCRGVQMAYERRVTLANGYKPEDYYALPCDQAEPILTKAAEVRERKRREAEELARRLAEARAIAEKARREHIDNINQQMAAKYADTPEAVASRTSALEKQIRANGGRIPGSCSSPKVSDIYCPPTMEEVRLAVMRRHSHKTGFKIVNGHLLHGKQPTAATLLFAMGGQAGKGMLGLELHYGEAELIYECQRRPDHYECRFRLPVRTNYDELTKMYMDGLTSGSAFNFGDFMFALMDSATAMDENSFEFWLPNNGLWRAQPTIRQELEDLREELGAHGHR